MPTISADELRQLRLFRERVAELKTRGFVQNGVTKVTLHLGITHADRPLDGFDEDYLRSFLQTLRQFLLQQEIVNVFRICDVIWKNCDRQELKNWTAYARSTWKEALAATPFEITVKGKKYNVEDALQLFYYSGLVHTKPDKVTEFHSIPPVMREALRMMLMASFEKLCFVLALLNKIIWHWQDAPNEPVPPFSASASST